MEEKKDKVRSFRVPISLNNTVEQIINESGKQPGEWFEDVINQISTNELVLEKNGVPADLRRHFSSDLAALKDATNSITSLFISQMNRVAVEKNNWINLSSAKEKEYEEQIKNLKSDVQHVENQLQNSHDQLQDANNHIIQLQNKIDGFDKLEEQLRKSIKSLEEDKEKNELEISKLRNEFSEERAKTFKDQEELRKHHKEEKDRLNQQIVNFIEELKKSEPINEENKSLKERITSLETEMKQKDAEFDLKIARIQNEAELAKEKAVLVIERELRELLYSQFRADTKELYEKIEKLQEENSKLKIINKKH
ncbi:hypothetical protein [Bacillus sp. FJAT-29937]|uniref:hypothetical protein n=1 Tax=Bacillus sp. FJAT-29937 TaxID=1720553 RepID=UPI00083789CC|nr:hypothetical protein [Bacillus sp. FJAT-29937]